MRIVPRVPYADRAKREIFSARELQVLRLLAQGLSNQQIAREMFVTLDGVKFHLKNLYGKLGVRGRLEAVVVAVSTVVIRSAHLASSASVTSASSQAQN